MHHDPTFSSPLTIVDVSTVPFYTEDDDRADLDSSCCCLFPNLFIYQEAVTKHEPAKRQIPENKMRPVKLPFSLSTRAPWIGRPVRHLEQMLAIENCEMEID